jgi:uncharacterized protein
MSDLYISWEEYHQKIEQLAFKIYQSDWAFNQIVCLAKGGLRVGDILCRIYDQPLAILYASSYGGEDNQVRGNLIFSRNVAMTNAQMGSRVLLVDDLVDSGITLQRSIDWLKQHYGTSVEEVRTACLWYKAHSMIAPDYYVDYLADNPWIHQPFEIYEKMKPEELTQQ